MARRMPSVFFGHGNPMNALLRNPYTEQWAAIGAKLPQPKAILCVSAHWYIQHTNPNAATIGCKRGTEFQSTGAGRRGTLLPYQSCSIRVRSYKTSGLPCRATSHRVDIEFVDRTGRGSSPAQARDPKQRRICWGHPRGRTYPAIMT